MDHSSITSCIAWLAPVADKKMGGLNALYVSGDWMWASTPTQSAMANQSVLPHDVPFAVPLGVMQLVNWSKVTDSALDKTRLVLKYDNGDTVKVPLLESGIQTIEMPVSYDPDAEYEWHKFSYFDALAHCAGVAESEGVYASVHFVGMTINASNKFNSRLRRAVTGEEYGNFCLPVESALYIAKIGTKETEISLSGECEWHNKAGDVIGHGPRAIMVRNGANLIYTSQLFTSAPFPWEKVWLTAPCIYNCEIEEGLSHYFTLIKSLSESGVAPAALLEFTEDSVRVTSGEEITGTVPVKYDSGVPPYQIKFQLSQWENTKGALSVSFGDTNGKPMVVHNAAGLDTAIMPMKV